MKTKNKIIRKNQILKTTRTRKNTRKQEIYGKTKRRKIKTYERNPDGVE